MCADRMLVHELSDVGRGSVNVIKPISKAFKNNYVRVKCIVTAVSQWGDDFSLNRLVQM